MNLFQIKNCRNISLVALLCFILFFFAVAYTFAQAPVEYKPLVGLPGLENMNGNTSIPAYINSVYLLIIGLGALVGVVKIAFAGVKYSLSDIVTDKESAKKDIKGVLLGLAILLIPFIVLQTIYPGLTNLDVLRGAQRVELNRLSPTGTAATPTISPTEFIDQAGDYTTSGTNLGITRNPVSAEELRAYTEMCRELNANSTVVVSRVMHNNISHYGYSCSK